MIVDVSKSLTIIVHDFQEWDKNVAKRPIIGVTAKRLVGKQELRWAGNVCRPGCCFKMGGEKIKNSSQGLVLSQIATNTWFFNAKAT
jgi:hypothetical protein